MSVNREYIRRETKMFLVLHYFYIINRPFNGLFDDFFIITSILLYVVTLCGHASPREATITKWMKSLLFLLSPSMATFSTIDHLIFANLTILDSI